LQPDLEKPGTALALFQLVNIIVQEIVSDEKAIAAMYSSIPDEKLKGIEDRGKRSEKKKEKT